jgi:large subunit ribosomal protein L1
MKKVLKKKLLNQVINQRDKKIMARKRSKRYLENKKKISEIKTSSLNEAIKTFKSNKTVKFDETLDISIMLNKEKNKGEGLSRGFAKLPNGTGKKVQVAVFATGEKTKEAKDAGADIVGNEDLIKDIKDGKINFDVAVATPDMMKDIAVIGEKLGPLGIMPNPKT